MPFGLWRHGKAKQFAFDKSSNCFVLHQVFRFWEGPIIPQLPACSLEERKTSLELSSTLILRWAPVCGSAPSWVTEYVTPKLEIKNLKIATDATCCSARILSQLNIPKAGDLGQTWQSQDVTSWPWKNMQSHCPFEKGLKSIIFNFSFRMFSKFFKVPPFLSVFGVLVRQWVAFVNAQQTSRSQPRCHLLGSWRMCQTHYVFHRCPCKNKGFAC